MHRQQEAERGRKNGRIVQWLEDDVALLPEALALLGRSESLVGIHPAG